MLTRHVHKLDGKMLVSFRVLLNSSTSCILNTSLINYKINKYNITKINKTSQTFTYEKFQAHTRFMMSLFLLIKTPRKIMIYLNKQS